MATKDASTRSKVGWWLATSCHIATSWWCSNTFGTSKVYVSCWVKKLIRLFESFNGCLFMSFQPFARLKPTKSVHRKLSESFLYWHDVESEKVCIVFEQLFSEANIKEAQRCARRILFVLSYISRKEAQVVGDRRFQLAAGWQPNLHIVLEQKVWPSWVGTMHRRCEILWCWFSTVPRVETCKFITGHHGNKMSTSNPRTVKFLDNDWRRSTCDVKADKLLKLLTWICQGFTTLESQL